MLWPAGCAQPFGLPSLDGEFYPNIGRKVKMLSSAFVAPTVEELRNARKKRILIKMLAIYGDDSTDGNKVRVYAFAGVAGTQEEWDYFSIDWLTRTEGIPFHATDCEAGKGAYEKMPYEERMKLSRDLTRMLVGSKLFGCGTAIDLKAFRHHFKQTSKDDGYFYCFLPVVVHFFYQTRFSVPPRKAQFSFDQNPNTRGNAAYLYDKYLSKHKEYADMQSLIDKDMAFADSDSVGIQVADLFVYEVMREMMANLEGKVGRRPQFELLDQCGRFEIKRFHAVYWHEYSKKHKDVLASTNAKYDEWRMKHNIKTDNHQNQIRYLIYAENIK